MSKWISVKERLPEPFEDEDHFANVSKMVTHCMPLPKPSKE